MKRIYKNIALTLLLLVLFKYSQSQNAYQFRHLTIEDGLSNSNVRAFLKDQFGYLWIGTESGLNRYDGYGFKVFSMKKNQPNALWSDDISRIQEDGLGNIWLSCSTGYIIYNHYNECFINDITQYLNTLNIKIEGNYKVYVDKNKDIWVITRQNISVYKSKQRELKVYSANKQSYAVEYINFSDDGDNLFGVESSGKLWKINKNNGRTEFYPLTDAMLKEAGNRDCRLYVDKQKGIWLYTNDTDLIYYLSSTDSSWRKITLNSQIKTQSNVVVGIVEDAANNIWIGTDHKGIFIYNHQNGSAVNLLHNSQAKSSIASNNAQSIYYDDNGIIWIGHFRQGISFYHSSFNNFINISDAKCKDVNAILEGNDETIWLGTDGNGLFRKANTEGSMLEQVPIPNNAIVSLMQDKKQRLWIGTYLNGLFCYENGKLTQFTKANSQLTTDIIWNIKEDRYGKIWIGHLTGNLQYLPANYSNFESLISSQSQFSNCLHLYYNGGDKFYIGTSYGLIIYDIVTHEHSYKFGNNKQTQQFKQFLISNVCKDNNDLLWLGHSQGLTLWDLENDTLLFFDKNNGLCDNIVRGIIEDENQNIWVTTSNGISVITPKRETNGKVSTSIRNFTTNDGLMDNYFNNNAICKRLNGDIILGSTEGYTIINPNKVFEKNQQPANVLLTGLKISNQSILVDSLYNGRIILKKSIGQTRELTFRYSDKQILLEFSTLDLLNSKQVLYAYKLEGFNDQWITSQTNKIEFSTLPAGNYRLSLKACNSNGVWNQNPFVIPIKVIPPFYRSTLAFVVYYLLVFGLIILAIVRTRKRHQKKLVEQKLKLESQQEASLNELKLKFFTNIGHDLRTPLTLIITPLQTILSGALDDNLRRKLDTINKNAEQLLQHINSLLDFRKLDVGAESLHLQTNDFVEFVRSICAPFYTYAADRNISFSFNSETTRVTMQFDPDKVHKIVINLLSNAFKFTPDGGEISVTLFAEPNQVCLQVTDTGQGVNETDKTHIFKRFYQASHTTNKTGSGIGLHIVSEYVKMHGGTVNVTNNMPQGSIFEFKLPLRETLNDEITESDELDNEHDNDNIEQMEHKELPALLFVDDNTDLCDYMAESLSDEYQVIIAHNGLEALDILNKNHISVVVSDIMMPEMTGTELCHNIKTNIEWSHIPVILLTARTADEHRLKALELGADDYINKPFNFNLLKLRIQKFLEWQAKCHHTFSQKVDVSPSEITITPLDEKLIEKAIKFVEEHIADTEFSVEDLGLAIGLSRSHLYKKLMSITGKGPAEFIRTIRLKRGRQLLEKSQLQIAEIAYMVGFNSPKRFTINFKHEFGISPSEYIRSRVNN